MKWLLWRLRNWRYYRRIKSPLLRDWLEQLVKHLERQVTRYLRAGAAGLTPNGEFSCKGPRGFEHSYSLANLNDDGCPWPKIATFFVRNREHFVELD